jgi:hypothetical protein
MRAMAERRVSDMTQPDGEESEALPTDLTGSFHSILPFDSTEQSGRLPPPSERFLATVAVLLTIGLSLLVGQVLLVSPNPLMHSVGVLLCVFLVCLPLLPVATTYCRQCSRCSGPRPTRTR